MHSCPRPVLVKLRNGEVVAGQTSSFDDAAPARLFQLSLPSRPVACPYCDGRGKTVAEADGPDDHCLECRGAGRVVAAREGIWLPYEDIEGVVELCLAEEAATYPRPPSVVALLSLLDPGREPG